MDKTICFVLLCYYPDVRHISHVLNHVRRWQVIVVDNTSENDLKNSFLKDHQSKNVAIIQTEKNLGYAGGMNMGTHKLWSR